MCGFLLKHLILLVCGSLQIMAVAGILCGGGQPTAGRFRYGHISYRPTPDSSATGNVEFTIDTAWAEGWEKITLLLNFGDGTPFVSTDEFTTLSSTWAGGWIGSFTDASGVPYHLHRHKIQHTYASLTTPYTASLATPSTELYQNCCRSGIQNVELTYAVGITVRLNTGLLSTPRAFIPAIIQMYESKANTIDIKPFIFYTGSDSVTCSYNANGAELALPSQGFAALPAEGGNGLIVTSDCKLQWDLTSYNPSRQFNKYAVSMVVKVAAKTFAQSLDFIIELVEGTQLTCAVSPGYSVNMNAYPGQTKEVFFDIAGGTGGTVSLKTMGLPSEAFEHTQMMTTTSLYHHPVPNAPLGLLSQSILQWNQGALRCFQTVTINMVPAPSTSKPTTRKPSNSPTTRKPSNSPTTRKPSTAKPTKRPTTCSLGEIDFEVRIKTDNFPQETAWTLHESCFGSLIMSGGSYTGVPYTNPNTVYTAQMCIPNGRYWLTRNGAGSYEAMANIRDGWSWTTTLTASLSEQFGPSGYTCPVPCMGSILETWTGISGTSISDLMLGTNDLTKVPNTSIMLQNLLEAPTNIGDSYGVRMTGWLVPPVWGVYTFYIASDDAGEFWLSQSFHRQHKLLMCRQLHATLPRQWTKYPEQKSLQITLDAGTQYYYEALMKEGNGGDNLAIAWEYPGQALEVIPTKYSVTFDPKCYSKPLVRKVRVQLLGGNWLQLREVEVFNQLGFNVALNKTANQSSTYGSHTTASKAVDGNKNIAPEFSTSITNWQQGAWWEVNLGEAMDVKRVKVYNRFDSSNLVSHRLSNSTVSLIDNDGRTLKTYTIGNASNIPEFDIDFNY